MKYLIFLLSFSAQASFIGQTNADNCDPPRTTYSRKDFCEGKELEPCIRLPKGYNCKYFRYDRGELKEHAGLKQVFEIQEAEKQAQKEAREQRLETLKQKHKDRSINTEESRELLDFILEGV